MDEDEIYEDNFPEDASYDKETAVHSKNSYLRAENEDDDGYDPYSDRPSYEPLFERDPWA